MLKGHKKGAVPKEYREFLVCLDCKKELPHKNFYQTGVTTAGNKRYSSRCNKCYSAYQKTYTARKIMQGNNGLAHRDTLRKLVRNMKIKCSACGYDRCVRALDLHHVDPATKKFNLSMIDCNHTIEEVEEELRKCIVLCANCHREQQHSSRVGQRNAERGCSSVEK